MALDLSDEILQDFLVEGGEILEQLNEQLVDMEQSPEDQELLNAVVRGFHTIKGGAGFLALHGLVEVCHNAEDVFNLVRQGQRAVDSNLMDTFLQVIDVVNDMFAGVREGIEPEPAERELIAKLAKLSIVGEEEPPAAEAAAPETPPEANHGDEALDELLSTASSATPAPSGSDDITEEEFDNLLDELHGSGPIKAAAAAPAAKPASGDITEEEFDNLLDELHGSGPIKAAAAAPEKPVPAPEPEPEPEPEPVKKPEPAPAAAPAPKAKTPAAVQKSPPAETTVRVDTQRLDDIMNMVGELVLVRNRLATLKASMENDQVSTVLSNLDVVTSDLQLAVMKTRMQPIKKVFGRFPRVVRDLARSLDKEMDLVMEGEDTDLDKNLVEALADPLVHLVRNSVDHGIEMPDDREAAGKPRKGKILLAAVQEGDHIVLSITDDGKGMDADVLRGIAVERGMMDAEAAARLDDKDCYNLIFHPGFSTKSEISDISGRGVGMDVVKTRIAQMNGSVEIDSELGAGSRILIKLPLTLAILPTLMVILGEQPFALPLASVVEIFNLDLSKTNHVDGQQTIRVRGRAIPLFYLRQWLVPNEVPRDYTEGGGHVVVVNVGNVQVGLVVDQLVGQEEVVIKPLGALLQGLDGMAGATITGDGKIALIMDVPGLMRKYAR